MTVMSDFKSVVSSNFFSMQSGSILSHRRTAKPCSLTQNARVLALMGPYVSFLACKLHFIRECEMQYLL